MNAPHESSSHLHDSSMKELMDLFKEKNYWQRLSQMFSGLGKPRDSREYKIARTELQRQMAPLMAILLPTICVLLLAIFANATQGDGRVIETQIQEVEEIKDLEEILQREDLPDEIQPQDIVFTPEIAMATTPSPTTDAPVSPQPAAIDTVMTVRSPVILRNIFGSTRTAGVRGQLITDGGGNAATETAVMRALRWLKTKQNPDGSWGPNKNAMTALTILCYLAHGEKPDSEEFGPNVRHGIEFLLGSQPSDGRWRGNYEHYIVTYALCEAYGMTMNPNIRSSIERAVKLVIEGQHSSGGWDYALKQNDRDDTSVMGWAAQAIKAAMMAEFYSDPESLLRASKLSVKGFQKNAHENGGFGYISKGRGGLSSVGVLGMQFHNAGNYTEVRKTLEMMDNWIPVWNGSVPGKRLGKDEGPPKIAGVPGPSTQYYYYYATQAMFQSGGRRWRKWNDKMWPEYVKAQFVQEKAIADPKGVMQDIGWWENGDTSGSNQRPVMDTCLAALQLMVYYRYLPTFKAVDVPDEVVATVEDIGDIKVEVNL